MKSPRQHRVDLLPLGKHVEIDHGSSLETALQPYGVEFPCGGAGTCRGCRVRVTAGELAITPEMEQSFSATELAAGWRLACRANVMGPLTLEIAQWEMSILTDHSQLSFEAGEGCAVAIDIGTTTLVAQLLDLATGEVVGVETGLNPQTAHGADVMSRIQYALAGGAERLADLIREALGNLIGRLPRREPVRSVLLGGNTAMHHLFCGLDVSPLAHAPFQPTQDGEQQFTPQALGWDLPESTTVRFLPCLGGFVGSDILAGILATGMAESDDLVGLIDLGTNGEIVVGNKNRLLCASTAAGPAFEGGQISMGMRAASGAISHVCWQDGKIECRVIGGVEPRGICGSGLVDAAAVALDAGLVRANGRLVGVDRELPLVPPVVVKQADIRELQLAKAAISAGLRILLERWGGDGAGKELRTIHLAGAFGNYIDTRSARRIGLLESGTARIEPAGNTCLRGLKMALFSPLASRDALERICARTEHIPLAADPRFEDTFVDCMSLG